MLFKILHGDESNISLDIIPFHEGWAYVTHSGYFYVDLNIGTEESPNNQRIKLNAKDAETLSGKSFNDLKEEINSDSIAYISIELAKRSQLKPEFANSIEECTDTTKLYVLPDGYIYAGMPEEVPLFTNHIVNGVDADGNPFAVENNGFESSRVDGTSGSGADFHTGFIPYNLQNLIKISGLLSTTTEITTERTQIGKLNFYDENKTEIVGTFLNAYIQEGAMTYEPQGYNGYGVATFDLAEYTRLHGWYGGEIASKAKYIRVEWREGWYEGADRYPSSENAMVLLDEEIEFGMVGKWTNTGHAFVPADYEDRIVELEERTENHENRIKTLETYGADTTSSADIPAYIKAEANDVMSRLMEKQGNRVFNMIAMSDFHYSNYAAKYGGEVDQNRATLLSVAKATSYMLDRIHIDAVATLGDNTPFGAVTQNDITWANKWFKEINEVLAMTQRPGVVDFRTVGNHDRMGGNDADGNPTPFLPDGAVYQYIQGYNRQCDYLSAPVGYGYKDFEGYKLRVIVLNTAECEGKGRFSEPHYGYFIGNAQYNWLVKALDISSKEDASDWQILILSHHRADDAQVGTDETTPWYNNGYILPNILYAYKTGGSYSANIADEGISVSCNFAGKNQARLIGQIHGHHHSYTYRNLYLGSDTDASIQSDIVAVSTPTTSHTIDGNKDNNGNTYSNVKGTAEETAFCVYAIDLDEHKIHAIHYGVGLDREINY